MRRVDVRAVLRADRLVFAGLLAVLAWAPVPLGSNRPWSSALLAALACALLAWWALSRVLDDDRVPALPVALLAQRGALACLALWVVYTLIQALPLPPGLVEALAPASARDHAAARDAGAGAFYALSVDRSATLHALARHAAYVSLAVTAMAVLGRRARMRVFLHALLAIGFAEALYGLTAYFGADHLSLWRPGEAAGGGVSGTYVNRNHLAGLLELTIPAALALVWLDVRGRDRRPGLRGALIAGTDALLGPALLYAFAAMVMVSALILTGSRAGVAACVGGLAVAAAICCARRMSARALLGRLAALAVLPVIAVAWLGTGALGDKLTSAGLASNRADLREIAYEMIAERPLTGSGAGTFRWVFPAHKDARFGAGFYEHAHNDPLELIVEQGVLGAGLVAVGVLALALSAVRGALVRRDRTARASLFAAIAGVLSLLAHGLFDFNLQIPANAAIFFALLGLGVAASAARGAGGEEGSLR